MPAGGFESPIAAGERLQTHALDRAAAGIGTILMHGRIYRFLPRHGYKIWDVGPIDQRANLDSRRTWTVNYSLG
jgi:hypothetical protein